MQKQTSYAKATEVRQKAKMASNSFSRKTIRKDLPNERSAK